MEAYAGSWKLADVQSFFSNSKMVDPVIEFRDGMAVDKFPILKHVLLFARKVRRCGTVSLL